ncbi:MAG: tetratricopeptide repeat protein [bacterium ADurb.Bin363]|nr:MAG: tetratricopeptide repeat protein [bacterium ADurb.Bin363]
MSKSSNASFKVAQTFAKQGDIDQAIAEYEKLIQVEPQNLQICYELVDLYARRGLISKVTDQFLRIADIYLGETSLEKGIEICHKIIRLDPESIKSREKLIEIYSHMENKDEVREQCFALSRICSMQGQSEKALEFLQKGIEVDPDNLDARLELAIMNVKQGHIKEGIAQYKEVAQAFWAKKELSKACDTYKRVTVLQPDDTETHLALGTLYRELRQLEDAKNAFRFILRYDLTHIKALTELGLVCQEKGEIDSAILAFRKIVDINPMKTVAREKLGELYLIRGQVHEAVKEYFAAAEDYQKQGLTDNAIQMCETVVELDCKHAKALRMMKELGYTSPPPQPAEEEVMHPKSIGMRDTPVTMRNLRRPHSGIMNIPRPGGDAIAGGSRPVGAMRTPPRPGMVPGGAQQGTVRLSPTTVMNSIGGVVRPTRPLGSPASFNTLLPEPDEDIQMNKRETGLIDEFGESIDIGFSPSGKADERRGLLSDTSGYEDPRNNMDKMEEERSVLISSANSEIEPRRPSTISSSDGRSELKSRLISRRVETPGARPLSINKPGGGRLIDSEDMPLKPKMQSVEMSRSAGVMSSSLEKSSKDDKDSSNISIGDIEGDTALLAFDPDGGLTFEEEETSTDISTEIQNVSSIATVIAEPPLVESSPAIVSNTYTEDLSQDTEIVLEFRPEIEDEVVLEEVKEKEHVYPETQIPSLTVEEKTCQPVVVEIKTDEESIPSTIATPPVSLILLKDEVKQEEQILEDKKASVVMEPTNLPVLDRVVSSGMNLKIEQCRMSIEANSNDLNSRYNLVNTLVDFGLLNDAIREYEEILKIDSDKISVYNKMIELYNLSGNENELRLKYLELGSLYRKNSIFDSALDIYQRLIALNNDDVEARENMAEILLGQDKKRESIYQYIALANIYSSKGQIKEVVDIYQKMLKIEPEELLTHTKLAETYAQLDMKDRAIQEYLLIAEMYLDKKLWNNAIESYEAIVGLSPDHLDAHVKLSQLYMKSGMSSKAIEENLVIADIYMNQGKYDQAMDMAQNVIGAEPTHITAREKLIEVYHKKGLGEKAIVECQNLSEIFLKKNDVDKAIELYEKILEIEPKYYEIHFKLAELYEKKGFNSKAMQEYIGMAEVYTQDGNYFNAVEAYNKVLSFDQNNLEARYQLGVLLADKMDDLDSALKEFELIRRLSPTHMDALQRLTLGYIKTGQLAQAIQVSKDLKNKDILGDIVDRYKEAIDKNPDDYDAKYNLGIIYKEFGDLENAIEQFQSLVKCPEKLLDAYNMLGLCFEQMGMGNLAINQFKKGLSSEGYSEEDYKELRYNLGLLYERRGMLKEALIMYEEIFGLDIKYRDVTQRIQQLEEQIKGG